MSQKRHPAKIIEFRLAVQDSDIDTMQRIFKEEPDLFRKLRENHDSIVCEAAKESSPEVIRWLIERGADVNEQDSNGETGLCWAVMRGRYDVAKVLLECGADPNLGCPIFGLATSEHVQDPIALAKLLLDYGADINQPFLVEGLPPRTVLSEAIERGRTDLVKFLKSRGAKLPGALPTARKKESPPTVTKAGDYTAGILAHFHRYFGKPEKRFIREIVPTPDHPVTVHYIPRSRKRNFAVLFTIGLSRFEMPVPQGSEPYRRAELMVALPKTWPPPEQAIKSRRWAWPMQWLRKIAAYPVANNTWLGGPWTVVSNEEPPQPLGPGTKFTAWVLASPQTAELVVRCKDGSKIQIYQLFPLYTEEYLYEREHGAEALISLFVRQGGLPEYIDVHRPNAAVV